MNNTRSPKRKTCPYCSVPLALDAESCFSCKHKIGKANKYSIAEKPVNYRSHITCSLFWVGFYLYMRWAFF